MRPSNQDDSVPLRRVEEGRTSPGGGQKQGGLSGVMRILVVCSLYMTIGPTLILVNKHVMRDLNFRFPMFLSGLGLVFSSCVSHILVRGGWVKLQHEAVVDSTFWMRNVFPVGAAHAGTLTFGNAVYLYLTVSFIQMLKAFTPVMVMVVLVMAGLQRPSQKEILAVVGICVGTAVASAGEINLSFIGLCCMFLAEFTEAIRLVLTQYLLKNLKFGIVEGQYWLAPAGALCLFSMSAFMELPRMLETGAFDIVTENWPYFFLAGSLGLGVQFVSFLVIQATSSVTIKVLGTARNAGLVVFSVLFFGETVTAIEGFGYAVSLSMFGYYNYLKLTAK